MAEETTALEEIVADFLRKNPDFFEQYPDILEHIEINHGSGNAVSLIERQVERLRDANRALEQRLESLVTIASENEKLISRLHRLTLELAPIKSHRAFFQRLEESLRKDFDADIVRLYLMDHGIAAETNGLAAAVETEDPVFESFRPLLDKDTATCGRFNEAKMTFLFGERGPWVRSTALVPIGPNGAHGIMAIGSSDQNRFYPGMGTLFLDLLAEVITSRLSDAEPQAQRRSA
jgi:hypothetical protein